jgi:hypothetical protein
MHGYDIRTRFIPLCQIRHHTYILTGYPLFFVCFANSLRREDINASLTLTSAQSQIARSRFNISPNMRVYLLLTLTLTYTFLSGAVASETEVSILFRLLLRAVSRYIYYIKVHAILTIIILY